MELDAIRLCRPSRNADALNKVPRGNMHEQRRVSDVKTRYWLDLYPNEIIAINSFRRTLALIPIYPVKK